MSEQPLVTVRAGARANDELKPRTIQVRPLHLRGMDLLELVEEPGVLGRWCGETPVRVRLGYIPGSLAKKPHTYGMSCHDFLEPAVRRPCAGTPCLIAGWTWDDHHKDG